MRKVAIVVYKNGVKVGYGNSNGDVVSSPQVFAENAIEKLQNAMRAVSWNNSGVSPHIEYNWN